MAKQKQIDANRRNALHSTGPKTPAGKTISSRKALKHELRARAALLPGEDKQAFQRLFNAFRAEHRPLGRFEKVLVEQMAVAYWKLSRLTRIEFYLYHDKATPTDLFSDPRDPYLCTEDQPDPRPLEPKSPAPRTQTEPKPAHHPCLHPGRLRLQHPLPPLLLRNAPRTFLLPRPPRTRTPPRKTCPLSGHTVTPQPPPAPSPVLFQPGSLLSSDGQPLIFTRNILNDTGTVTVNLNRQPGAAGVSGSGALATFTFQAVGPGATILTFTQLELRDAQAQPIAAPAPQSIITIK